jgi:hypothetical protein
MRTLVSVISLIAAINIAAAQPSTPATNYIYDTGLGEIWFTGPFEPDSGGKFQAVVAKAFASYQHPNEIRVKLWSGGGSAIAGIQVGEIIRQNKLATEAQGMCASACAIAWLGGIKRYISHDGYVGFHGVYDITTKEASGQAMRLSAHISRE